MTYPLSFSITARDPRTWARCGVIHTPHGDVETPVFIPVGTQATVKTLTPDDLLALDVQIILANTYHLYLRPGADTIERLGGLHRFMAWDRPILTDSGGFQVFSLGAAIRDGVGKIADIFPDEERNAHKGRVLAPRETLVQVDDEGVTFKSHLDGSLHRFTPELSIEIQHKLGADIILAFDECTSPLDDEATTARALHRTHRWAVRSLRHHQQHPGRWPQALFGIVQGGAYRSLREESARFIRGLSFDGFAIGGSLGRSKRDMHAVLEWVIPLLPEERPRHLLGIGEIEDIFACVRRGVDMFDCVTPTRWARNGAALISPAARRAETDAEGDPHVLRLSILRSSLANDPRPLEPGCACYTCQHFSRAYLHHLFMARELLGYRLVTIHNLHMMVTLMRHLRQAIMAGALGEFEASFWRGEAFA